MLGNVPATPASGNTKLLHTTSLPPLPPVPQGAQKQRRVTWWPFALLTIVLLMFAAFSIGKIAGWPPTPTPAPTPTPTAQLPQGLGTITTSGEVIGVNDGSYTPIDIGRSPQEMAFKQQAAKHLNTDRQGAIALWDDALKVESNDAEALIYLEDQRVRTSGDPYITLIAGTAFTPPFPDIESEGMLQGIYVAQYQYNKLHHGGTQLLILVANSGTDADASNTIAVAEQIIQIAHKDKTVVGVIGWLNSSNTLEALPTLTQGKIPFISPQASSDKLSSSSRYFFRVVPPNLVEAQAAATFSKDTLHVKNPVVFLDTNNSFSSNLAHDFEQSFANSNVSPYEESFTTDKTTKKQFAALIQDALKNHADAFYFTSASNNDTGLFQDALPVSAPPVIAGDGSYVAHNNSHGRWYLTAFAYHDESTIPIATQFAQEYNADFNSYKQKPEGFYGYSLASDHAILSYDATSVALAAVDIAYKSGITTLTAQDLANTLPQISVANAFQGVSGQIAFDPKTHDPINKAIVILSISKQGYIQMNNGIEDCFMKGSC